MPRAHAFLLVCALAASSAAGQYFDMSEGDPGMDTPCPAGDLYLGTWTEEDASWYPAPPEGPLDGQVLTSQSQTRSCIRTPQLFTVDENYSFQMYVFMPTAEIGANVKKLQVMLLEEDGGSYLITELSGPSEAKWHLVQADVPSRPGIIYPGNFKVEILITADVDFAAIRWFGVSDEMLPPPPEPTDPPTTTEDIETTTDFESTTNIETTTAEPTTELETTTKKTTPRTTTKPTSPTTTSSPGTCPPEVPCSCFPDVWSSMLGFALGVLFMSFIFFLIICCWWFWAVRSNDEFREEESQGLPRLEVHSSNGSHPSITGSWNKVTQRVTNQWQRRKYP